MRYEKLMKFHQRIGQLALMTDALKVQEVLSNEYGIHLSVDETRMLRGFAPKIFTFRVIELWVAKQSQEALAWAASVSWPQFTGVDLLQLFIEAARKTLPNLNRDMLDEMLPDGPGKAKALDLAEAATDPYSLANRVLATAHPSQSDYANAAVAVLTVWNLRSPTEAAEWLQNSALDPTLKSDLQKIAQR